MVMTLGGPPSEKAKSPGRLAFERSTLRDRVRLELGRFEGTTRQIYAALLPGLTRAEKQDPSMATELALLATRHAAAVIHEIDANHDRIRRSVEKELELEEDAHLPKVDDRVRLTDRTVGLPGQVGSIISIFADAREEGPLVQTARVLWDRLPYDAVQLTASHDLNGLERVTDG